MQNNTDTFDKESIIYFIKCFDGTQYTFLNGCCYWFCHILNTRFGGITFYESIDSHFVQKIGDAFYDVRGDVTDIYKDRQSLIRWDTLESIDSTRYKRIIDCCVTMVR